MSQDCDHSGLTRPVEATIPLRFLLSRQTALVPVLAVCVIEGVSNMSQEGCKSFAEHKSEPHRTQPPSRDLKYPAFLEICDQEGCKRDCLRLLLAKTLLYHDCYPSINAEGARGTGEGVTHFLLGCSRRHSCEAEGKGFSSPGYPSGTGGNYERRTSPADFPNFAYRTGTSSSP